MLKKYFYSLANSFAFTNLKCTKIKLITFIGQMWSNSKQRFCILSSKLVPAVILNEVIFNFISIVSVNKHVLHALKINVNLRLSTGGATLFFYTIFKQKRNLHTDTNLICKNVFTEDHLFDICMSYAKHFMLIAQCKLCSHSFDITIHKTNHKILFADILWNNSLLKSDVFFSMDIGINIA